VEFPVKQQGWVYQQDLEGEERRRKTYSNELTEGLDIILKAGEPGRIGLGNFNGGSSREADHGRHGSGEAVPRSRESLVVNGNGISSTKPSSRGKSVREGASQNINVLDLEQVGEGSK